MNFILKEMALGRSHQNSEFSVWDGLQLSPFDLFSMEKNKLFMEINMETTVDQKKHCFFC